MNNPLRPVEAAAPAPNIPTAEAPPDELRPPTRVAGKTPVLLLWLLGIPVPIILIIFLMKGCS